jgi:hypothetical protein
MPEDLWPENIAESKMVTPVTIIKEQAALLGEKTKQLVRGEVESTTTGSMLVHHFYVVAPTMNYRYELFTAQHNVSFYPLVLRFLDNTTPIPNEAELKSKLKEIFSQQHTVNVVHSILAQARS